MCFSNSFSLQTPKELQQPFWVFGCCSEWGCGFWQLGVIWNEQYCVTANIVLLLEQIVFLVCILNYTLDTVYYSVLEFGILLVFKLLALEVIFK